MDDRLRQLPHGPEFRFVDEVIELDPGRRGRGRFRLTGKEAFLRGHFPGRPMMPGALMIEALAQLGGLVAQSDPDRDPLDDLRLAAVRSAKITGTIEPGGVIDIAAEVTARLGALIQIRGCIADSTGRRILDAQLTLGGREGA